VSTPWRVLIVDDEAPARARLRNLLEDVADQVPTDVVAEAADGVEALERLDAVAVDVALVDIRMPRMDGIELARHLAGLACPPAVIFVTAYDQYAVKAFELSAVDYLLKPVRAERLAEALRKASRSPAPAAAAALRQAAEVIEPGGRRHLRCAERGKLLLVPVAEVVYFKAELKYVTARTVAREFLLEESLAQLETEFEDRFLRIHRNCLVARAAIVGFEREHEPDAADVEGHWAVLLRDVPERLPVSRRQWQQVKAAAEGRS
jgi:two-component system, LytTR family, response regulator AlgR